MRRVSVVVTTLLIATALGGVAGPTSAVGARAGSPRASWVPPKVLILGDSYSAGTGGGAYDQPDFGCHRSANTWGQVLGQSLGAVVVNRACNGAVTANMVVTGGKQQGLNTYAPLDGYATKAAAHWWTTHRPALTSMARWTPARPLSFPAWFHLATATATAAALAKAALS